MLMNLGLGWDINDFIAIKKLIPIHDARCVNYNLSGEKCLLLTVAIMSGKITLCDPMIFPKIYISTD